MRCSRLRYDVTDAILIYIVAGTTFLLGYTMDYTDTHDLSLESTTLRIPRNTATTQVTPHDEVCCSGVLGYASDNVSLNFPCQDRPCCNSSETVAVVSIDYAMGFRFECMSRSSIEPLCYEYGTEVRTSNQDPDFIPRACCPGLKFKIVLHQWYAALVVKCVDEDNKSDDYS